MSGGQACMCKEKLEPIIAPAGSNRPGRLWRVMSYRCNHSTFHGGYQSSRYSGISCLRCGSHWRTKAPYADSLSSIADEERNLSSGIEGHEAAMAALGREPHKHGEGTRCGTT